MPIFRPRWVWLSAAAGLALLAVLVGPTGPRPAPAADTCADPLAYQPIPDLRVHRDFQMSYQTNVNRFCNYNYLYTALSAPAGLSYFAGGLIGWTPAHTGTETISLRVDGLDGAGVSHESAQITFHAIVDDNTMTSPKFRDYLDQDQVLIQGRALGDAGTTFSSYKLQYATLADEEATPGPWIDITGTITSPVTSTGTLGTWDISNHTTFPDGARMLLRLVVNLIDSATGLPVTSIVDNRVIVDRNAKAGWPKRLGPLPQSPTVADLDDDGVMEVLVTAYATDIFHVFNLDGSLRWEKATLGADAYAAPTVADIDGDKRPDILLASVQTLSAYRAEGTLLPGFPIDRPSPDVEFRSAMTVADVTGDGRPDIIANLMGKGTGKARTIVYTYVNGTVAIAPGWPKLHDDFQVYAPPSVADLDSVAGLDIVAGGVGKVYAWHGDGTPLTTGLHGAALAAPITGANTTGGGGTEATSQPALADLDGDGQLEIIVGSNVLGTNGQPKAGWVGGKAGVLNALSAAVGDVDQNPANGLEVSIGSYLFRANGSTVPGWPVSRSMTPTVLADCGSGDVDVMAGTRFTDTKNPGLLGYELEAVPSALYPKSLYGGPRDAAGSVIGDFDGDGRVDMAAIITDATYGGILAVYNGAGPYHAENSHWPMLGHDLRHTGLYTPPAPNRPLNLRKTVSGTTLSLTWSDASQVEDGFLVERSLNNTPFSYTQVAQLPANATSYQQSNANDKVQNATYRVRAKRTDPRTGAAIVSDFASVMAIGDPASYDATLKAPRCSTAVSSCDSVGLLIGPGEVYGPEPHTPNTLGGTCVDGSSTAWGGWVQRLRVFTPNGSPLHAGATATIGVDVFINMSSFAGLTLYTAADANNPVWVQLQNWPSPLSGSLITHFTASYTIPAGATNPAIRATFARTAGVCDNDPYADRDDLVFAVTP